MMTCFCNRVPRSIVIVGAGYIACEFACIQGLGVAVTQVIRGDHILKGAGLSDAVREGMEELGVTLCFGLQPTRLSKPTPWCCVAVTALQSGCCAASHRTQGLSSLDSKKRASTTAPHCVDAQQRTNVPHIHAVGDVTDRINLTPVAVELLLMPYSLGNPR